MVSSVLLIDDDQINTSLSKMLLLRCHPDLSIHIENDAYNALDYLKDLKEKMVIFLDLNMPGMDGIDFMREFRKLNIDSKIFILTSIGLKSDTIQTLKELGCNEVLLKPLTSEKVSDCLLSV